MTDKITAKQTDVSADSVNQEPVSSSNKTISEIKASPLFGWLFAGSDLLSSTLEQAAGLVSQKLDETNEAIQSMQDKGLEVERELKRVLNPFAWMGSAQKMVASNPLLLLLPGAQKRQQKAKQLDLLNAKVELLVEQVALLAAKEAAAKAKKAQIAKAETGASDTTVSSEPKATEPKATAPKTASRVGTTKRSTAKAVDSKPTASKVDSATTKSSGVKTTPTRKSATSTTRKVTTGTKASPKKEESTVQSAQSTDSKSTENKSN